MKLKPTRKAWREDQFLVLFIAGAVLALICFFWDPIPNQNQIKTNFASVDEAVEYKLSKKNSQLISKHTFGRVTEVAVDEDGTLVQVSIVKENKEGKKKYKIVNGAMNENYFEVSQLFGKDSFESLLNGLRNAPKVAGLRKTTQCYITQDKTELEMTVNGNKAAKIDTYQKNGKEFYFLYFTDLDYRQDFVVE